MTWRDIYCSASCHPGRPRERLWKPGWIQRDTFCEIQETSWMTRAWRRFESSELLLWNESDSSCPCRPHHRAVPRLRSGSMAAAPTPQRHVTAAALFDYGRLWGSFSKGSLKNEGGICSTVVKTVGSLQFCNERDAKAGKGSVLLAASGANWVRFCTYYRTSATFIPHAQLFNLSSLPIWTRICITSFSKLVTL